ncbi:MAG: formylglycine-generating enzyme family protein [Nostoc sp.]
MTPQQPQRPQPPSPPAPKPQPPADLSRRRVIQNVGWTVAGFSLAIVGERLFSSLQRINLQTFPFETVAVNAQGKITNRSNREAKYFVEDLGNGVTLEMVQILQGTFTMGSPEGEAERESNESPQHQVKVPGFFMGKYEVTQAQYQAIMGTNPSYFKGEKRPVERVSWDDAVEFCKRLSQKTGKTYRLPSEAEWEYACRVGTTTPFYFGETITTDLVNYNGNFPYGSARKGEYRRETTDVGKFRANSFGLYDMYGNVWEWCQDVYNNNYLDAPRDGSAWINDKNNIIKLLRGGSFTSYARNSRSARRDSGSRDFRSFDFRGSVLSGYEGYEVVADVGFRLVAVAVA